MAPSDSLRRRDSSVAFGFSRKKKGTGWPLYETDSRIVNVCPLSCDRFVRFILIILSERVRSYEIVESNPFHAVTWNWFLSQWYMECLKYPAEIYYPFWRVKCVRIIKSRTKVVVS